MPGDGVQNPTVALDGGFTNIWGALPEVPKKNETGERRGRARGDVTAWAFFLACLISQGAGGIQRVAPLGAVSFILVDRFLKLERVVENAWHPSAFMPILPVDLLPDVVYGVWLVFLWQAWCVSVFFGGICPVRAILDRGACCCALAREQ